MRRIGLERYKAAILDRRYGAAARDAEGQNDLIFCPPTCSSWLGPGVIVEYSTRNQALARAAKNCGIHFSIGYFGRLCHVRDMCGLRIISTSASGVNPFRSAKPVPYDRSSAMLTFATAVAWPLWWPEADAYQGFDGEAATTLYAARGRLIPFNSNSPTGSTVTAFSTFVSTRGLIRICPA